MPPSAVITPVKALEVPAKTREPVCSFRAPAPERTFESVSTPVRLTKSVPGPLIPTATVPPARFPELPPVPTCKVPALI